MRTLAAQITDRQIWGNHFLQVLCTFAPLCCPSLTLTTQCLATDSTFNLLSRSAGPSNRLRGPSTFCSNFPQRRDVIGPRSSIFQLRTPDSFSNRHFVGGVGPHFQTFGLKHQVNYFAVTEGLELVTVLPPKNQNFLPHRVPALVELGLPPVTVATVRRVPSTGAVPVPWELSRAQKTAVETRPSRHADGTRVYGPSFPFK
ncbi:hypothetical protein C8R46DRAFT_1037680 [Mycena filopes]|nr:hypothetical protein C8R46DRAFT_1037680 [Mycena filopes]